MPNVNFHKEEKNKQTQTHSSFFQKASAVAKDTKDFIKPAVFSMLMAVANGEKTTAANSTQSDVSPGAALAGVLLVGLVCMTLAAGLNDGIRNGPESGSRYYHRGY